MKVVIGLGNPGQQYARTRHNVGFLVVEELARRLMAAPPRLKFDALLTEAPFAGEKLLLAEPQTYMNLSGRSVRQIVRFYDLPPGDLVVVCDDINLKTGQLRFRRSGTAGGQKGLKNIIDQLGTTEFPRLRVGVGRPPERMDAADYVLGRFRGDEEDTVRTAVQEAADGVELWIREGADAAMNRINAPG